MPDFVFIAGKLKKQGKFRHFCIAGFYEYALCVQLFSQNFRCKFRGDEGDFQVTFVSGVVAAYIVHAVISIKGFIFAVRVKRQIDCTGQLLHFAVDRHFVLVVSGDFCPVDIFQAKFDLVLFHSHDKNPFLSFLFYCFS